MTSGMCSSEIAAAIGTPCNQRLWGQRIAGNDTHLPRLDAPDDLRQCASSLKICSAKKFSTLAWSRSISK